MRIIRYHSAKDFITDNLALLQEEEAANNLIIGLAFGIKHGKYPVEECLLFAVIEAEKSILCALQTPNRNLTFYGTERAIPSAVSWLNDHCEKHKHIIPGLVAPKALSSAFGEHWQQQTDTRWKIHMEQRVFQLDQVTEFSEAPGFLRKATPEDKPTIARWLIPFHQEAIGEDISGEEMERAQRMLDADRLYLWENEKAVSMAASTRATANGISINAVFTPKEFRRKGYASSCVGNLCRTLLAQGHQFCSLFTDASNPTSNKIYQEIGFKEVAKFQSVKFLPKE
ncbi:MAG: GNAT family N-acetyltransferase [Saprospiraceae bacterium]|nr:GNAT family N-acetyltransferase [Saprospiraceae bacterium]